MSKDYDNLRYYNINEKFEYEASDDDNLFFKNRLDDILEIINNDNQRKAKEYIAIDGEFGYYKETLTSKRETVALKGAKHQSELNKKILPQKKQSITVDLKKLYDSAKEMGEICAEDYCADVLITNTFSKVVDGNIKKTDEIKLEDVTNMVGMVGAGKSTFVKALCYHLAKENKRIVLVLDTVPEVLKTQEYFHSLNVDATPLIGKSERVRYIKQLNKKGEMYLKDQYGKYLTSVCLVDGLSRGEEHLEFGQEPCFSLEKEGKKHKCGYYDICPSTIMERNTSTSNIVITTVQAFAQTRVNKELFLKKVLYEFDLVVFDECDRVQKVLDELFCPSVSVEDFIIKSGTEAQKYLAMPLEESTSYENGGYADYCNLLLRSKETVTQVINALKFDLGGFNSFINKRSFSAYILIESLMNDSVKNIDEKLYKMLIKLNTDELVISDSSKDLSLAFDLSSRHEANEKCEILIKSWFKANGINLCTKDRKKCKVCSEKSRDKVICNDYLYKVILILRILSFEKFFRDLENAYNNINSTNMETGELFNFLNSKFRAQQDFLPSSVMGNIFGLISEDNLDIKLFKQYAFGRSLMTELPFLVLDEKGQPQGPNVLLLSGSSFAPSSFGYHVNRKVDYLIEGDEKDKGFLGNSKFINLAFDIRISGTKEEQKNAELVKLSKEASGYIANEIKKDKGKILVIVNSYEQAKIVSESLNINLKEYGYDNHCIALIKDSEKEDDGLKRSDVSQFSSISQRVMVAPAIAIERGHNIVDERGHSTINSVFFFVRPMAIPDDIKIRNMKANGYIAGYASKLDTQDIYSRNKEIREKAVVFWNELAKNKGTSLNNLPSIYKADIVASLFVLILQIFGRASRITDYEKEPPSIYFVDGAFSGNGENSFDFLLELRQYLDGIMKDEKYKEIANVLYGPFYTAFKKGIM